MVESGQEAVFPDSFTLGGFVFWFLLVSLVFFVWFLISEVTFALEELTSKARRSSFQQFAFYLVFS